MSASSPAKILETLMSYVSPETISRLKKNELKKCEKEICHDFVPKIRKIDFVCEGKKGQD